VIGGGGAAEVSRQPPHLVAGRAWKHEFCPPHMAKEVGGQTARCHSLICCARPLAFIAYKARLLRVLDVLAHHVYLMCCCHCMN
jgi:hypothetical protein